MPPPAAGGAKTVLISGAGVAGPALAHWLLRAGMTPVMVESAPRPRTGGYMIDFWGLGFEVAERMDLTARLRVIGYGIEYLKLLDARGRTRVRLGVGTLRRLLGDRFVSLPRGDLAATLHGNIEGRAQTVFGDEVTALEETGQGVMVSFLHQPPRRFDLVIGADGLHSNIRRLVFGADGQFEAPLGRHVAAFSTANYPRRDQDAYVSRTIVGRQMARYSLREGRTAFFTITADTLAAGRELTKASEQKAFLGEVFADIGSEAAALRAALDDSSDFYFDTVSQVRMPTWSKGRVALVGDAAFAPSLLAGEGAALAMLGAYVLAGELAAARGDHERAFRAYERRLKALMDGKQRAALRMAGWFTPRSSLALFLRDQATRLAGLPGLDRLFLGPMITDGMTLPDYPWEAAARPT